MNKPFPDIQQLLAFGRAELARLPNGNPSPRKRDDPLRSAQSPQFLQEKREAAATEARERARESTGGTDERPSLELIELSSAIAAAYVSHNTIGVAELPSLLSQIHAVLNSLSAGTTPTAEPAALRPAVPVKRSITPDYLICLEDGKKFKSLKRHLRTVYGLSPDEYRARWGLPPDYPMVAPNYSESRSALAKSIGLGRQPATSVGGRRTRAA